MPAKDKYHDVVVRALKKDGWTTVPEAAYKGIVQERIGELAIRHVNIKLMLMVFDVRREEVVLWIP